MNFEIVPVGKLHMVWSDVEPYLARACKRSGDYSTDDLLRGLIRRDFHMWEATDADDRFAVCVAHIDSMPCKRVCEIVLFTGKRRELWGGLVGAVEKWAKEQGCSAVRVRARPGTERSFPDYSKLFSVLAADV